MKNLARRKAIRFIFYNTEYFEGLEGVKWKYLEVWRRVFGTRRNLLKICKELLAYKPDVVAFAEIQMRSFFRRENYGKVVKEKMNMKYSLIRPKYLFKGLIWVFRYLPLLKDQSNAVFSGKKLIDSEFIYFERGIKKMIIKTSIKSPKKVTFLIVHLALSRGTRLKQLERLVEIVNRIKGSVVLAGDFNNFDGDKELNVLIENTRLGRLKESFTFPTFEPVKTLDHILVSSDVRVENYEVLDLKLSDHLPVMIDFRIK